MNNTELAIKFSNEKYCTRKDVVDTMKTPLIDSIWNSVLEYRSNFSIILSLKHINNTSYSVCLTPTMVEHEHLIRPAMVVVSKHPSINKDVEKKEEETSLKK